MHNYPTHYTPSPSVVTGDDYFERHIVDIQPLGVHLHNYLTVLLKDHYDAAERVQFVYHEAFAQMVLAMDNNYEEFQLRLICLPNFQMLTHVHELDDSFIRNEFTELFKEIAIQLFEIIYRETNPLGSQAKYFADATALTYMVVVKSFEPGMTPTTFNL